MDRKPEKYANFYNEFFKHDIMSLEHFSFLEFLTLTNESDQASVKEAFDNYSDIIIKKQKEFKDEENELNNDEDEDINFAAENSKQVKIMDTSEKSIGNVRADYFNQSLDEDAKDLALKIHLGDAFDQHSEEEKKSSNTG